MDWSNEPYVRVYTRETDDDMALSWEAMAVWNQLMKRFDRSGFIETRRGARGVAAITRIPASVVERVLAELLEDGRLVAVEGGFVAPNFIAAQEATKSDRQRQKDSRDRRRAQALDVTKRDTEDTKPSGAVTKCDADVTNGHATSRSVTLTSANQGIADHSLALTPRAPAIPPSTGYDAESPGDRIRLAFQTYERIAAARLGVAEEYGLDVVPMPPCDTPAEPIGLRDLKDRIRAEGPVAPQACEAVILNLLSQAREERSTEWLSEKAFTEGGWRFARNDSKRHRAGPRAARSGGAIGSATPRTNFGEDSKPAKEVF